MNTEAPRTIAEHLAARAAELRGLADAGHFSRSTAAKHFRDNLEVELATPERWLSKFGADPARVAALGDRYFRTVYRPGEQIAEALEAEAVVDLLGPRVIAGYRKRAAALSRPSRLPAVAR